MALVLTCCCGQREKKKEKKIKNVVQATSIYSGFHSTSYWRRHSSLCRETAPEAGDHKQGDCKQGVQYLCLLFFNETAGANVDHIKKMQPTPQWCALTGELDYKDNNNVIMEKKRHRMISTILSEVAVKISATSKALGKYLVGRVRLFAFDVSLEYCLIRWTYSGLFNRSVATLYLLGRSYAILGTSTARYSILMEARNLSGYYSWGMLVEL